MGDAMNETPKRIWLLPFDGEQRTWCDQPDPAGLGHGADADEYIRADLHAARIAKLEAALAAARRDRAIILEERDRTFALMLARAEAAEAQVAKLVEAIRAAHDALWELNPNNYTHDEVCQLNDASVEAIFTLAPLLGETHGKTPEWWAERAALSAVKREAGK